MRMDNWKSSKEMLRVNYMRELQRTARKSHGNIDRSELAPRMVDSLRSLLPNVELLGRIRWRDAKDYRTISDSCVQNADRPRLIAKSRPLIADSYGLYWMRNKFYFFITHCSFARSIISAYRSNAYLKFTSQKNASGLLDRICLIASCSSYPAYLII